MLADAGMSNAHETHIMCGTGLLQKKTEWKDGSPIETGEGEDKKASFSYYSMLIQSSPLRSNMTATDKRTYPNSDPETDMYLPLGAIPCANAAAETGATPDDTTNSKRYVFMCEDSFNWVATAPISHRSAAWYSEPKPRNTFNYQAHRLSRLILHELHHVYVPGCESQIPNSISQVLNRG